MCVVDYFVLRYEDHYVLAKHAIICEAGGIPTTYNQTCYSGAILGLRRGGC